MSPLICAALGVELCALLGMAWGLLTGPTGETAALFLHLIQVLGRYGNVPKGAGTPALGNICGDGSLAATELTFASGRLGSAGETDAGESMKITGTQTIAEGSGTAGHTVEYVFDSGAVLSVRFSKDQAEVNRTNPVNQAKQFLERVVQEGVLPEQMDDGENVDGRAATMASSPNSPAERLESRDAKPQSR